MHANKMVALLLASPEHLHKSKHVVMLMTKRVNEMDYRAEL